MKYSEIFYRCLFQIFIGCLLLTRFASGQDVPSSDRPAATGQKEYRLIASNNADKLGQELNAAAREGFRFAHLSSIFSDSKIGVLIARQSGVIPTAPAFEYKTLGASRIQTIRRELEAAVAEGYELRGMASNASIMMFTVSETIFLMERPVGQSKPKYEYRFLTANREETMQKEMDAAVSEGFHPVAMSVNRDNNAVSFMFGMPVLRFDIIMRRSIENPAAEMATREYRFLSTLKPGTLEKEMNRLAKEGYRFHLTTIGAVALMSREYKSKVKDQFEYQLLATRRTGTLEKELIEAGKKGWRYLGMTGLIAVMERNKAGINSSHEYRMLAALRKSTTQKELDAAVTAGSEVLDLISLGEFMTILDHPAKNK